MPMNLIEQMEILKGLSDQQLAAEMQSPTGGAAPFMVATEISRRRDMRQRYMNEAARQRPQTTVIEDITMSMPQMGMMPPQPGMGGGIAAAAPQNAPAVQAFAEGGLVDAYDYNSLARRYQDRLDATPAARDRAAALALIAAGAGIMGGGHSNTLQNVGIGASAGLNAYQKALSDVDSAEEAALRGLTDLGELQHRRALADAAEERARREFEAEKARGFSTDETWGLTPQAYEVTNEDGTTSVKIGVMSNRGGFKEVPLPAGGSPVFPVQYKDAGTKFVARDKFGNPINDDIAIDNAGAKFDEKVGTDLGAQIGEARQAAVDAQASMAANERALALLDKGVITGFGADFKLGLGKALQEVGVHLADDEIANTEAFVATRALEVGRLIKMFGAGTGLSDADREFATMAAAGKINMTEESIRRILRINNDVAQEAYEKAQTLLKPLEGRSSIPAAVLTVPTPMESSGGDAEIDGLVDKWLKP